MNVSVVTPSYNRGEFLIESVESALLQTYESLEVIIVDDGSTDKETLLVLDELALHPRISVIHQENSGVAAAINTGVKASRGEFILVLADDDLIAPTYAEKAVTKLREDETLGVVSCRAGRFGAVNSQWEFPPFSPAQMAVGNCVHATSFYRRSDWEAIGGYREGLRGGYEDYDFWIRMIMLGRGFEQLPEELFFRRVGHPSLTSDYNRERGLKSDLLAIVYSENEAFFASQVSAILNELTITREELRKWKANYSAIDRIAGRAIRSGLSALRWFRNRRTRGLRYR